MEGSKINIVYVFLVLTFLGCSSLNDNKFRPKKDRYQYFFGMKLPVLSDNKKQFIVTNKMRKAIKNVKDFKWEEYHNNEAIKRKYFIGTEDYFYDYRKNKEIRYELRKEPYGNSFQNGYYKHSPYLKILDKKVWLYVLNNFSYYPNGRIKSYDSNIYSVITNDCSLEYSKAYTFSENGEVLFQIDYEKNFSMKLTKVFELASTYLPNCTDSTKIDLTRKFDKNNGYWVISQYEPAIRILDSTAYDCKVVIIDDKAKKIIAKKEYKPEKKEKIEVNDLILQYNKQYNKDYLTELYKKRQKIVDSLDSVLKNKKW